MFKYLSNYKLVMFRLIGIGIGWNRVTFKESASASESGFEHPIPDSFCLLDLRFHKKIIIFFKL